MRTVNMVLVLLSLLVLVFVLFSILRGSGKQQIHFSGFCSYLGIVLRDGCINVRFDCIFFYIFHSRSVRWASRTCVFVLELMCPMIFGTMDTSGGCVTISCCVPLFLPALALSFLLMVCVWFPGYFCLWYKSYFFIKLVNSLFWWLPGRVVWI